VLDWPMSFCNLGQISPLNFENKIPARGRPEKWAESNRQITINQACIARLLTITFSGFQWKKYRNKFTTAYIVIYGHVLLGAQYTLMSVGSAWPYRNC